MDSRDQGPGEVPEKELIRLGLVNDVLKGYEQRRECAMQAAVALVPQNDLAAG